MSRFIVEEGEGLSNSNQYVKYTEVLAYAMSRYGYEWFYKNDDCVIDREIVDKAIVSASDILNSHKWGGCRRFRGQAMEFPRAGLFNNCDNCCAPCDAVPQEIREAAIIITLGILKGDIEIGSNSKPAKVKSMSFDKQSIEFLSGAYLSSQGGCGGMKTVSGDELSSVRHLIDCFAKNTYKANLQFVR